MIVSELKIFVTAYLKISQTSRNPTFDVLFTYFDFFGVLRLLAGQPPHKFRGQSDEGNKPGGLREENLPLRGAQRGPPNI